MSDEVALKAKLRMIVSHATGGSSQDIDASVNDICVRISAHRNVVYQAGKDRALEEAKQVAEGHVPPQDREDWGDAYGEALDAARKEIALSIAAAIEALKGSNRNDISPDARGTEGHDAGRAPMVRTLSACDNALIEQGVQAAIDAGLAVNGRHGVAAARVAARFVLTFLKEQPR